MTFHNFIEGFWDTTFGGLVIGAIYALIALGYTLVYGVLRLINFAHSEVFMIGAFGSFWALDLLGVPDKLPGGRSPLKTGWQLIGTLAFMFVVSVIVGAAVAVLLERIAYRPLRKRGAPRLIFLISAIGASFALSELVGELGARGRDAYNLPRILEKKTLFTVLGVDIRNDEVIIFAGTLIMTLLLIAFVSKTRTGRGIRAVAQDMETARIMGVNVDRIILITFLVGGVMAGAAAFLYELKIEKARNSLGFELGVKAFTAAVLGGIGNIKGALVGGLALGVIENWGASMFGASQQIGSVVAFVVLVLVLMFRPTGLLGEALGRSKA